MKERDEICRYKNEEGETIYLTDVIIADKEIIDNKEKEFQLLQRLESSNNILVLEAKEKLPKFSSANEISLRIHHLIDYNCKMLDSEMKMTLIFLLCYCIILSLWFYRNLVHYPNTMTVMHRLLSVPPCVKFFLMVLNYLMFFTCPWKMPNLKIYIILLKILLNLVFESMLLGSLFLISMGFKIARTNISMQNFVVMLS